MKPCRSKGSRNGKGSHALKVVQDLISSKENWFNIEDSDDYNFPGVFTRPFPQRLGFCQDISKLPNYEITDPHFIFTDIQLGKGKARPKRLIEMNIDGLKENVYYRLVPCAGVKRCGKHSEGCSYVAPTSATKPCSQHPDTPLERSGECPVDFFYVWPEKLTDNRRWLTGMVRSGDLQEDNLHNHPLHKEIKIPVKVDTDIRRAVIDNPHLRTSDLLVGMCYIYDCMCTNLNSNCSLTTSGKGMQYMPGAACLAATHRSKVKNIRLSTLRDSSSVADPRSAILDFEKDAHKYDNSLKDKVEGKSYRTGDGSIHPMIIIFYVF